MLFNPYILIIFTSSFIVLSTSRAENIQSPQACSKISSALLRLTCFDEYFKTPIRPIKQGKNKNIKNWQQSKDKRVHFLLKHLFQIHLPNKNSEPSLRLNTYANTGIEERLLLTTIATEAMGRNEPLTNTMPTLIFQCYQDITSIQILWPENLNTDQIDLRIWGDDDLLVDSSWHVLDESFLITSPRGLPAIHIIKRLFNKQRITIESRAEKISFKAKFTIKQLNQEIKPLAKACHWL